MIAPPWGVLWLVLQWVLFTIASFFVFVVVVALLWGLAEFLRGALEP